jgi:hypothetical protein
VFERLRVSLKTPAMREWRINDTAVLTSVAFNNPASVCPTRIDSSSVANASSYKMAIFKVSSTP